MSDVNSESDDLFEMIAEQKQSVSNIDSLKESSEEKEKALDQLFSQQKKTLSKINDQLENIGFSKQNYQLINKKIKSLAGSELDNFKAEQKKITEDAKKYVESGDVPEALKSSHKRKTRRRLKSGFNPHLIK